MSLEAAEKNKNIMYVHILRIIACFLVIVNHTHGCIFNVDHSHTTLFYSLGFAFCKMAVAIFIIISSILMLDKDYTYKKVFEMIMKVAVPVVAIGFLFTIKGNGIANFNLLTFIKNFLTEPYIYPYWYIYMLFGFYLVLPFLQKMVKNFREIDYKVFIIVFLVFPCFLSLVNTYFGFSIYNFVFLSFFPKLLGLAVAGNYISKIKLDKKYFIAALIIFVTAYVGMFLSVYVPYLISNSISYSLDSWDAFPVILMACSFTYIMRYFLENHKFKMEKFICAISKTTFGIYLLHMFINWRIAQLGIIQQLMNVNCVIGILVLEMSVFVVCFIIVFILEQIPIVKRFI